MNTHTALKRLGRLEYAVVRTSLDIVDERVVQQFLADDSVVRQSFERALDYLDEAAAKWLHEPESAQQRDRPSRAAAPMSSTPTSSTRTSSTRTSDPRPDAEVSEPAPATHPEPVTQPEPAEEEQIEELATELLEEQQTETFAGELDEDEELRRVQAELNAKRLIEEQESGRRPHPE